MSIADKLTPNQVGQIKRMGQTAGLAYARAQFGSLLDDEEFQQLNLLWRSSSPLPAALPKTQPAGYDPHRKTFISMAWLLGASLRQLGRKFAVTPGTIQMHLDRILRTLPDRNASRLAQPPIDEERLDALHKMFYKMVASDQENPFYKDLDIITLANAMNNIDLREFMENPDDDIEPAYADLKVKDHQ